MLAPRKVVPPSNTLGASSMNKPVSWLVAFCLIVLSTSACLESRLLEPEPMVLEVAKQEAQRFQVSFSARIAHWDGETPIQYQVSVCSGSGELFICIGDPLLESSVVAESVIQPVGWTSDQCGLLLNFEATLGNSQKEESSHITCS